jgi:hypothetical protein
MNEVLKTTEFLFGKIKKLYPTFTRPDEIDVSVWVDILDGYSQTEILEGLKNYRKNVPYNVAPLPAKFKEYLPERKSKAVAEQEKRELPSPEKFMADDIKTGDCRNNLYVYRDAFEICLHEFLPQVIPADIAEHSYYPKDVQLAVENGVFFRFGEAMHMAAQRRFRRDYEFSSENDLKAQKQNSAAHTMTGKDAVNIISAHWRA